MLKSIKSAGDIEENHAKISNTIEGLVKIFNLKFPIY